tara:strand:+ start:118 stop:615 length:498 start_codon:yes stop_codon:yes gene_type:complete
MNNSLIKKLSLYFLIILIIFALDRISKVFILNILEDKEKVDIYINSFLNFYLVWNKGIGFGLFSFDNTLVYNLITILIVIINFIIIYLSIIESGIKVYFFMIILGGSLGNLFDRLYYSAVPDFIDLNFNGYHWFIFNVADIFITVGIICLILFELLNYKSNNEKK